MADDKPSKRTRTRSLGQGARRVEIINAGAASWRDMYHYMVGAPWSRMILILASGFLVVNTLFATLYMVMGGIEGAHEGSFMDAFFFSVQTIGTIGYGVMSPKTLSAHLAVTLETMVGMMGMAITTGLVFSKFSRPTARIMFSKVIVIASRDGVSNLMFRVANERNSSVVEANLRVSMLRTDVTKEGEVVRKLYDLPLVRSTSPAFILTWTAMHQMMPGSPFAEMSREEMERKDVQILVSLTGIEETLAQTIHARQTYTFADLRWDVRFADVFVLLPDGRRVMDYGRFHEVVPVGTKSPEALFAALGTPSAPKAPDSGAASAPPVEAAAPDAAPPALSRSA